ncbi:MAG: hypothetical protein IPJ34_37995 [Myxococcales bacterium]|nr:hypothetical protein [Myxococcales bacterium]
MRTPLLVCLLLVGCAGRIEPEQTPDAASEASPETSPATSPTTTPIIDSGVAAPEVEPPPKGCDPTAAKGALVDALGTACLDEAQWKDTAATACKAKGGVASLRVGPACGLFRYRNFRCCGVDGTCTDHRDGSESSCKPLQHLARLLRRRLHARGSHAHRDDPRHPVWTDRRRPPERDVPVLRAMTGRSRLWTQAESTLDAGGVDSGRGRSRLWTRAESTLDAGGVDSTGGAQASPRRAAASAASAFEATCSL